MHILEVNIDCFKNRIKHEVFLCFINWIFVYMIQGFQIRMLRQKAKDIVILLKDTLK